MMIEISDKIYRSYGFGRYERNLILMLNDDVRKESAKGRPNKLFEIMYTELLIEWDGMHRNCKSFFLCAPKKRNEKISCRCIASSLLCGSMHHRSNMS